MVTANCSGGVISLTSQILLTEEQVKKVQQNKERVNAICKDLHVSHIIDEQTHTSRIGINYDTEMNLEDSVKVLKAAHDHLLTEIDSLDKDDIEDLLNLKEEIGMSISKKEKNKALDELRKHLENGDAIFVLPQRISRDPKKLAKFIITVDGILSTMDLSEVEADLYLKHEDIKTDQPE